MKVQQFDFSLDLMKVIPWKNDSTENLMALMNFKQSWYAKQHQQFWEDWERDVFNLWTANDFGLNVWSIILDLPLYTNNDASPPSYKAFGFGAFGRNFGNGNFATDPNLANKLSIEEKRLLLLLRWRCITSDGSMYDINKALKDLPMLKAYCLDGQDMTITYIFTEAPSPLMMTIIKQYDILPRPSGVKAKLLVQPRKAFGFANYGLNFDQSKSQFGS